MVQIVSFQSMFAFLPRLGAILDPVAVTRLAVATINPRLVPSRLRAEWIVPVVPPPIGGDRHALLRLNFLDIRVVRRPPAGVIIFSWILVFVRDFVRQDFLCSSLSIVKV